jgi:hypothetical protein
VTGVAVDGDRQNFVAARLVQTIQTRAYGTDNHRADDFEVRRVKRQRQVHQAAFGFHIGREAHVVLHVTGAEVFFMFAGEFVEQVLRFFTQHVDQHVQTTAVRHAQHHFAGAAFTAWRIISLSIGISASPPSSEKRFAPGNFAPR